MELPFFRIAQPLAGFAALVAGVPLLVVLETALFVFEPVSGWVLLGYVVYTVRIVAGGA